MIRRPRVGLGLTVVTVALAGCTPAYESDIRSAENNRIHLSGVGPDVTFDFACVLAYPLFRSGAPRMIADIDGCLLVQTDDGVSRLDYPRDAPRPPDTRLSLYLESGPHMAGAIDLLSPSDHPRRYPGFGDPLSGYLELPAFFIQPLNVLPDRLAKLLNGKDPVPAAIADLAADLVASRSVAVAGAIHERGLFTCRLGLTDAGRAKLRAALAHREGVPTTEPSGSAAGSPASRPAS